jgi:hypothetical protein
MTMHKHNHACELSRAVVLARCYAYLLARADENLTDSSPNPSEIQEPESAVTLTSAETESKLLNQRKHQHARQKQSQRNRSFCKTRKPQRTIAKSKQGESVK